MNETNFTPGPWYVHDETSYDELHERQIGTFDIRNKQKGELAEGFWIADVKPYETKGFTGRDVAIANAKLIAACPCLLEALRLALPYVEGAYECAFPDSDHNENVLEAVKAAIAKATT